MQKIAYTDEDLTDHHGIAAILHDRDGRVLVQDHVKYDFWTIPVGKARPGQTPGECLREELLEECNIAILEFREVGYKVFDYIRDRKPVRVIGHLFEVLRWSGELVNAEPHKHRQQLFLSVEEIGKLHPISDMTMFALEYLKGGQSGRSSQGK